VPGYVGIYGVGAATTKIVAVSGSTEIINVEGLRSRIERLTIVGSGITSGNVGICSCSPNDNYLSLLRLQDVTIRDCSIGVEVEPNCGVICFDVRAFDCLVGFDAVNANEVDLYNCYAYQLTTQNLSGTVGVRQTCTTTNQYVYLYNFNSWANDIAIQAKGTSPVAGGLIFGQNTALQGENTGIQINHAAKVKLINHWSDAVVHADIQQTNTSAGISIQNATIDYSKLDLISGGEANVQLMGSDATEVDVLRVRGNSPSFQLRYLGLPADAGGLWRIRAEASHLCWERNTHVSGAFATYSEDLALDPTGSCAIGDELVHWNKLDVDGTVAARNGGTFKAYQSIASGSKFFGIKAPDTMSSDIVLTAPVALPLTTNVLTIDPTGQMAYSASIASGEVNVGENLGTGSIVYAGKSDVKLQFKTIVGGPNVDVNSDATKIYISASATGEQNTASNLQPDFGLYASKSGVDLRFKTLVAGAGIMLSSGSTTVTVSTSGSGEVILGANVGTGTTIFKNKNISTLEFNSIRCSTGSLGNVLSASLDTTKNEIDIVRRPMRSVSVIEDDFIGANALGSLGWLSTTTGANSSIAPSSVGVDLGAAGVFAITTGTNSSGRASLNSYVSALRLDLIESCIVSWRVMLDNLSTTLQEYTLSFGLLDNVGAGDETDGVYFEYDHATTATDTWRICAASNSVRVKTTLANPVVTNVFNRFTINTSKANTAEYYINGSLVGTLTSSIPSGIGRLTGFGIKMQKTAGSTTRSAYVDYMTAQLNFSGSGR
jgi:hypothetical protein